MKVSNSTVKVPNEYSEAVRRMKTDNAVVKTTIDKKNTNKTLINY